MMTCIDYCGQWEKDEYDNHDGGLGDEDRRDYMTRQIQDGGVISDLFSNDSTPPHFVPLLVLFFRLRTLFYCNARI